MAEQLRFETTEREGLSWERGEKLIAYATMRYKTGEEPFIAFEGNIMASELRQIADDLQRVIKDGI